MERSVLSIAVFVIICSRTSAYAGWGFMEPLVTDADLPGVLKTYEINRKEYSTFRLYVELPTLNRNVEFRYLRKYENHDYHIEDFKATVRKFAVDNNLDTPEVENGSIQVCYSSTVRVMDLQRWCHQKGILGTGARTIGSSATITPLGLSMLYQACCCLRLTSLQQTFENH